MREIDNPAGWRDGLRLRLEDFVDEFVVEGIDHEEVFGAITAEIAGLRAALERDLDPAEEPEDGEAVAEPANDWPAAE